LVLGGRSNGGESRWVRREIRWLANKIREPLIDLHSRNAHKRPPEGIVYIIHRAGKVMQLSARLPTLLQLALEPTQYMIECQTTLPGQLHIASAHPSHPTKALRLSPRDGIRSTRRKRERRTRITLWESSSTTGIGRRSGRRGQSIVPDAGEQAGCAGKYRSHEVSIDWILEMTVCFHVNLNLVQVV
jgi:hypothetical protein